MVGSIIRRTLTGAFLSARPGAMSIGEPLFRNTRPHLRNDIYDTGRLGPHASPLGVIRKIGVRLTALIFIFLTTRKAVARAAGIEYGPTAFGAWSRSPDSESRCSAPHGMLSRPAFTIRGIGPSMPNRCRRQGSGLWAQV